MANPLQPKCIKIIEEEFNGYAINLVAASKSGHMDIVAGIDGEFWGFEIKWKNDQPSELQKQKINKCIDAGNRAFFIRDADELRRIIRAKSKPLRYELKHHLNL